MQTARHYLTERKHIPCEGALPLYFYKAPQLLLMISQIWKQLHLPNFQPETNKEWVCFSGHEQPVGNFQAFLENTVVCSFYISHPIACTENSEWIHVNSVTWTPCEESPPSSEAQRCEYLSPAWTGRVLWEEFVKWLSSCHIVHV